MGYSMPGTTTTGHIRIILGFGGGFSGPFPHPKAFCYTNTRPIITTMPLQARTKRRNAALQACFQWPFLRGERWHHLRGERWHHLRSAAPGLNNCSTGRSAILSRSAIPTGAGLSSGHHPPPLRRQMSVIIIMRYNCVYCSVLKKQLLLCDISR